MFTCVSARANAQTKEEQECSDIEAARQRAAVAGVRTPEHEPLPHAEHGTLWYGWQTLTADGLSLLAVPVAGAGVFSFLIATPIIHIAHGQASASAVSVGMRVVGTVLPAGLWLSNCFELDLSGTSLLGDGSTRSSSQASSSSSSDPICDAVLPGLFFVGLVGSITLDAAVFAYEPVPDAREEHAVIVPWYDAAASRGGVMLRGHL
ncbi:MAG TPA: hypothetical protein VJV78_17955 [Polyangiales bacterium]|nr:hypothetical protein [Polyangiales bacterium]